ncbi:hypothetical protein ACFPAG_03695 [Vogesella sp. GCM10023246]|uniref:Copper resistance protein D domain-containing protein n=1 Tax=Vogesella oryzagri TaxID=3160864 RepID=A0ABV1M259_9NEIS
MWNDYAIARGLHVLAIVLWVGGVAFVTTVLIPAIRRRVPAAQQYTLFESVEHRFGAQARLWVLLALGSGAWMLQATHGWARLLDTGWLQLMLAAWLPFLLMLFVLEPLLIHRWLRAKAARDPAGSMRLLQWLHVGLLGLTLVAVVAGVVGAHGGWRF